MSVLTRAFGVLRGFWRAGWWQKAAVLIVAGGFVYAAVSVSGGPAADTSIVVTRGSIAQTVSVTGQVVAATDVDLSFQTGGRVARTDAKVGDRVTAGQILASLDNADLAAQLRDAEATVIAQQATLEEMILGGSPQELAIAEANVRSAEHDLAAAYANTYRELSDAYNSADAALRIYLQPLFEGGNEEADPTYDLTFDTDNYTREAAAINGREDAERAMRAWQTLLTGIVGGSTPEAAAAAVAAAQGYAQRVSASVAATARLFDGSVVLGLEDETIEDYQSRVNSARSQAVGAIVSVNNHDEEIKDRLIALTQQQSELAYTADSATPQQIAAQRAAVISAQAQADRYRSLISKGVIRSPIDGIVTRQDAKVGQSAAANEVLVAVISDQQLEIEANIPEVDIGRVSVGDPVAVTVDALPGESFTASVSFIEPGETVIDGVVSFKVTALFGVPDARLKSGLTVNMDIETERRDGVLILPQFAVIENDDGTFVRGLDGKEVPVTLGIRSQDGSVEVISGLDEGSRVQNIGLKANGK